MRTDSIQTAKHTHAGSLNRGLFESVAGCDKHNQKRLKLVLKVVGFMYGRGAGLG